MPIFRKDSKIIELTFIIILHQQRVVSAYNTILFSIHI